MLQRIAILFLAAAVLFSAVGANVYELICSCEHLHQVSIFEKHHVCEHLANKNKKQDKKENHCSKTTENCAVNTKLHSCCLKEKQKENQQKSANFHKKPCCDFQSKYLQIDAKYYAFKGIKTGKTKKSRNFTPKKSNNSTKNSIKNMAQLAAFSEPPADVAAQRLARILHVAIPKSFESSKRPFGRLLRVRLASFLC